MAPKALLDRFSRWQGEMLSLLEQLVNIDSGTGQRAGIEAILDILEPKLKELGFATRRHPSPVGPHLVAEGTEQPQVLLMGHIDTVFPAGTAAQRPFRIDGNRAYGPGVMDMKAGIVTMIYVLKALALSGDLHRNARVIINADEEISSIHSRDLIQQESRRCQAAFVFEPARSMDEVTTRRKGVGDLTIQVKGRAAHAGAAPEDGLSAIQELARIAVALHGLTDLERGLSVNVGVVSGGTARNVIAEHAQARVDLRFATKADGEWLMQHVRDVCAPSHPGYQIQVVGDITRPPLERRPDIVALFQHVQEAGRALGIELQESSSGGVSDANLIADAGVPVIDSMGPVGGNAHSDAEYLEIDTIVPRAALAAWSIHEWLARQSQRAAS
ncbi:MAG: M20 family metallopeptidase [Firmicutes bacterium]|nr:M20 family metallopeptidase [Bacillota bacterium]